MEPRTLPLSAGAVRRNPRALLSRTAQILLVLLGVSFVTFGLTYLSPGDPVLLQYTASGAAVPPDSQLEAAREEMGLNDPFLTRYGRWLGRCLQGDLGRSSSYGQPVATLLKERLWPTLKLSLLSLGLMLAVSVPCGLLAAVCQDRWPDRLIRGCTFLGVSLPGFWVGLMLLYVFALKLKLVPVASMDGGLRTLLLPAATLAFAMSAKYTRQVRTAVLEELNQDYVTGARARGMGEGTILWRHVFPNALLPLVTLLGLSLGSLLGGTAVVEVIFSYPGLGNLAVTAITRRDYNLVQGYVLWIALLYMLINLLVDRSYTLLDPRMRRGGRT